ncbi:MAG: extracellular solute-binding protein [Syntrophomonadaceae bacterium]|nr:extracellular solute-binding protein [Syntrophomonadaceae bacterium]
MKRVYLALLLAVILLTGVIAGCQGGVKLDPKNPVTVIMWHNYGGQMQATIDKLIDEFNVTVGRERGIILNVTSVSATKELEEKLAMIAHGDPGAPQMPDIVTAYPRTAAMLANNELLAPLDQYFSAEELAKYIPQYIEEGRLSDDSLYVFPIAKSTEVLFVNQTLFDRFSAATGVSIDSLATFEGIAAAAAKYYEWTDAKTPNIPDDGKTFYTADSWSNIALVGMAQMGSTFAEPDRLLTSTSDYKNVWDYCVSTALSGGFAVYDGYSSDLSKTGDILCSTGSTAGILFYGDTITYPDNTTEKVSYSILPYPTFEDGDKIALQRGAGMVIKNSTKEKEYAATLFLKWFTSPDINMRFISSTGYLPVTKKANDENLPQEIATVTNANMKKLFVAAKQMDDEYSFIVAPNYAAYEAMSKDYENRIKQAMYDGRHQVINGADVSTVSENLFRSFVEH